MTFKVIGYTTHALEMMEERGFTRADVRTVLATGSRFPDIVARGSVYHMKVAGLDGREVGVVYLEDARRILIITVEEINQGE